MNSNFKYSSLKKLIEQNIDNINNLNSIQNSYFKTLSFLSSAHPLSNEFFIQRVNEISNMGTIIVCYFVDDNTNNTNNINNFKKITIIGTGTIIFEPKLIHEGRYAGHIEDIVVNKDYRGQGIAKNILKRLKDGAVDKYCYKIILDCKDDLCDFYIKNGFEKSGSQMKLYLN